MQTLAPDSSSWTHRLAWALEAEASLSTNKTWSNHSLGGTGISQLKHPSFGNMLEIIIPLWVSVTINTHLLCGRGAFVHKLTPAIGHYLIPGSARQLWAADKNRSNFLALCCEFVHHSGSSCFTLCQGEYEEIDFECFTWCPLGSWLLLLLLLLCPPVRWRLSEEIRLWIVAANTNCGH